MSNSYDLTDKFAIVTGAAKGIGHAIAELLIINGCNVLIWDKSQANIGGAMSFPVDVTKSDQIEAALAELSDDQQVDILINDAGYLGKSTDFASHTPEDWHQIIQVNLLGTMTVTQAILPIMLRQKQGRIINLGSLAGKEGLAGIAAYSAASAGVISFTKALSREVAQHGIFVNCVAPGPIDTDMIRDLGPDVVEQMINDSPVRRLGHASEVAHMVAWLCTDASRFNTGAVFDMSGGRARY